MAAVRLLQSRSTGGGFEWSEIQRNLLKYCLKQKVTPHKAQHRSKLKDIVRKVGDEVKQPIAGSKW